MAEIVTTDFSNKKVKETYRGILHFDSSLQNNKKIVYDGAGTKTSLTLGVDGQGADIKGNVSISNTLTVSGNSNIVSNLSVGGDVRLLSGGNINDLIIGEKNSSVSIRALSTTEVGKLRIRETSTDYELIFGNPNLLEPNLFSIIVKKDGSNNLYIKNNYNSTDVAAPLWIDRSTGAVNIKSLNVGSITNTAGGGGGGTTNSNRNTIPPGAIMMFPSATVPQGWLECDGSVVQRSLYLDLYSVIQQTYKTLTYDNDLEFQLPDLRGMFVRGWDHDRGVDSGRPLGTNQKGTLYGFDLNKDAVWNLATNLYQNNARNAVGVDDYNILDYQNVSLEGITSTGNNVLPGNEGTSGSGGYSGVVRPINISLVYCIKW